MDNYYNDYRVMARDADNGLTDINENEMTAVFAPYNDDDSEPIVVYVKRAVCGTCDGKGSHVNPSIDCNGISEFEDEDDELAYFSGAYDVPCYECKGEKIVIEIDEDDERNKGAIKAYNQYLSDEASFASECAAERRMGC